MRMIGEEQAAGVRERREVNSTKLSFGLSCKLANKQREVLVDVLFACHDTCNFNKLYLPSTVCPQLFKQTRNETMQVEGRVQPALATSC